MPPTTTRHRSLPLVVFPGLIDDSGEVTTDSTRGFLRYYMAELHAFIVRVYTVLPRGGQTPSAAR